VDYLRFITGSRWGPAKPLEDAVRDFVDSDLSLFAYSSCDDIAENIVAFKVRGIPGDVAFVLIDDSDLNLVGLVASPSRGNTTISEVDARHYSVNVSDAKARALVEQLRARNATVVRLRNRHVRQLARRVRQRRAWPPDDHWLLRDETKTGY
jgi:hypothetical protein